MRQYMRIRVTDKVLAELSTFSGELGAGQCGVGHKLKAAGWPSTSGNLGELGLHPQSLNSLKKTQSNPMRTFTGAYSKQTVGVGGHF